MKRFTFTAGIGKDRDGFELGMDRVSNAVASMRGALIEKFGGFTESPGAGGFRNDKGESVMEASMRWIVLAEDDKEIEAGMVAKWFGRMLNQESVMLETEEVGVKFVPTDDVTDTFARMSERTANRVLN